jgi:putative PIN family toxin of toxin-antitoxin system
LVLTPDLRIEYERVLARPEFAMQYGLTPEQRAAFLRRLQANALHVRPKRTMPLSVRDPKDTMVLAAAFGGKAVYIVTGDIDLLDLAGDPRLGNLQIVTVKVFLDHMASSD